MTLLMRLAFCFHSAVYGHVTVHNYYMSRSVVCFFYFFLNFYLTVFLSTNKKIFFVLIGKLIFMLANIFGERVCRIKQTNIHDTRDKLQAILVCDGRLAITHFT